MTERYLLITLAVILFGSIGAFFLYVPILPTIGVAVMLVGLVAMFWLGFELGKDPGFLTRRRDPEPEPWSVSEQPQ